MRNPFKFFAVLGSKYQSSAKLRAEQSLVKRYTKVLAKYNFSSTDAIDLLDKCQSPNGNWMGGLAKAQLVHDLLNKLSKDSCKIFDQQDGSPLKTLNTIDKILAVTTILTLYENDKNQLSNEKIMELFEQKDFFWHIPKAFPTLLNKDELESTYVTPFV